MPGVVPSVALALLEWLLSGMFICLLSLVFWRRVRMLGTSADLLALPLIAGLLISVKIMALGLLGILTAHTLAAVSLLGLCILLLARASVRRAGRDLLRCLRRARQPLREHPQAVALIGLCVGLLVTRALIWTWYLPPVVWDVNTYHLPRVAEWIQHANLDIPHMPVRRVNWPAGFELMQTWWAIFLHHDVVVELAGIPFYLLAIGSCFHLARQVGVSFVPAAWCAVVYACTPSLALNATSAKNDIAIASIFLYLASIWIRRVPARATVRRWALSFTVACVAMGIKATIVFLAPGLLVVALPWLRVSDFRPANLRQLPRLAGVLLLMAVVVGGYWYARNALRFGNPFYPTTAGIAGHAVAGGRQVGGMQQGQFSVQSVVASVKDLATRKIYDPGPYNFDVPGMTGWGWFFFACAFPTGVWASCVNRRFRWLLAGWLVAFASLLGWVTPDPWNMRFALWVPAVGAVAWAVVHQQALRARLIRYAIVCLVAWTTSLNVLGTVGYAFEDPKPWIAYARTPVGERSPDAELHQALCQRIPPGETMLFMAQEDDRIYPLYGPDFRRRIIYPDDRSKGFAHAMRVHGVRYIYFRKATLSKRHRQLKDADEEAGTLLPLGSGVYALAGKTDDALHRK